MAKRLNLTDIFCLGLNAIVGSGIFLFPGKMALLAGPASILAFLVCGMLLAVVALCYAELGGMFPRNGASYVYAREAYGLNIGFAVGWISWATSVFSLAAVSVAVSFYLSHFNSVFLQVWADKIIAVGLICLFGAINYRGIKPGARTVNFFTLSKVLPLLMFASAGLIRSTPSNFSPFSGGEGGFGYAVFLAMWALQGFEVIAVPAGESDNPQRDIPYATLGSLFCATSIYVLIQAAAIGSYPDLAHSTKKPLADAASFVMGPLGGTLISAGALFSMTGFIAGAALGAPRYLSALGEDGFISGALGRFHCRFGTPYISIFFTTMVAAILVLIFDFHRLVNITNLAVASQYFSTCLAVIVLRSKKPDHPRPFRISWPWGVGVSGCLISVWLATRVSASDLLLGAGILASGFTVLAIKRIRQTI
ncbi:MAG: APC family permease [bacterium]